MKKVFRSKRAAQELDISTRTLATYRRNGLISFTKVGHVILYTEDDLTEFLQKYKEPVFSKKIKSFKLR